MDFSLEFVSDIIKQSSAVLFVPLTILLFNQYNEQGEPNSSVLLLNHR